MIYQKQLTVFLCLVAITTCSFAQNQADIPYDSLQTVLEEMYDQDQEIRVEFMQRVQGGDSIPQSMYTQMRSIDSLNQTRVKQIITRYGWLPQSKIGEKAAGALYLIVQHSNLVTMQKYLPLLREAACAGEAHPTWPALMEDRIRMFKGKKQIYGTQASGRQTEDGSNEYFIWPIENPEEVNERRAKIGFDSTVEENAERLNAVYNPNEELPQ